MQQEKSALTGANPLTLSTLMVLNGGADGDRTHDLLTASQALSQLSYSPTFEGTGEDAGADALQESHFSSFWGFCQE